MKNYRLSLLSRHASTLKDEDKSKYLLFASNNYVCMDVINLTFKESKCKKRIQVLTNDIFPIETKTDTQRCPNTLMMKLVERVRYNYLTVRVEFWKVISS